MTTEPTAADEDRFATLAGRNGPFPASPFFPPEHSNPEDDVQALRYELDGCREKIAELRLTVEAYNEALERRNAEIERLRDLRLELLGAGRQLMECMPPPSRMLPEDRSAIARWDAIDAACVAPGVPRGE